MHDLRHTPSIMPFFESMPLLLAMLATRAVFGAQDSDLLIAQLGGVPHITVRSRWVSHLLNRPISEFRGDAVWYQYTGTAPTNVEGALSVEGGPLRRDIGPGEIFRYRGWNLQRRADFKQLEHGFFGVENTEGVEVVATSDLPWAEVRAMGFSSAKKYLLTLGLSGRSWDDLELEYSGHLLGDA